ncbi:MAG: recombinase family protein [Lachnospiraceae bacterium]|nr:recombinase family protein [Lachnospiraceae bacterium]
MRIAIYSRKSKWTGKGESVENQLTMCREYIECFIEDSEGAEIIEYEDEGFSGKNTRRPQFQRMMKDMHSSHFDYLVCYKLDRLGRNLADLANLMEKLEHKGTSFISIKERFDTTTPIGKAMLYFSGVLAQMEREQIAERVRDNMMMLARSGRWLGGNTPMGYASRKMEKETKVGRKKTAFYLEENADEISIVKFVFQYFLEKQSLTQVVSYMQTNGIKTRHGKEYSITGIRDILTNPVYCTADIVAYDYFYDLGCQVCIDQEELDGQSGLMSYAKTSSSRYKGQEMDCIYWIISKGKHRGILSGSDYVKVQRILECSKDKGEHFRKVRNAVSVLSGLLYCTCGHLMRPKNYPASRVNERGERTFAYLCPYKDSTHGEKCQNKNVHGNTLDDTVCGELAALAKPDGEFIGMLEELKDSICQSESLVTTERDLLTKELLKKQEQIGNLVSSIKRLEAQIVSVQYIDEEIRQLDTECGELQRRIDEIALEDEVNAEPSEAIAHMEKMLFDFDKGFSVFTVQEKRELLRSIVEKIVWDGKEAHIYLKAPAPDKRWGHLVSFLES